LLQVLWIDGQLQAEAERPGKASGRGRMVLSYDTITAYGKSYSIDTMGAAIQGKSGTAGDATKVVGGAAAGAILGKILGGKAGTGAAIGAAAGTGAALMTRGPDPVVKAGAPVTITLDRSVTVDAALFYTDWKNIQIQTSAAGFNFLVNGGDGVCNGANAEAESGARAAHARRATRFHGHLQRRNHHAGGTPRRPRRTAPPRSASSP